MFDENYPYNPPKLFCHTPIIHPIIDKEGRVHLSILRFQWKPIFGLELIVTYL